MHKIKQNRTLAEKRQRRVRGKLHGTALRPRLTVFRSNRFVYLQAIDDAAGKTIASVHQKSITTKGTKVEQAVATAEALAKKLTKAKVSKLVFDRGSYRYHGRVKAVAETLRQNGLEM